MKVVLVEIEITDIMLEARGDCGEDADCSECECCIGYDDCIFNHTVYTKNDDEELKGTEWKTEFDFAAESVKKQIPHKARDVSSDGIERYVCECGNLMHRKQAYCEKCGQRLEV